MKLLQSENLMFLCACVELGLCVLLSDGIIASSRTGKLCALLLIWIVCNVRNSLIGSEIWDKYHKCCCIGNGTNFTWQG